MELFESADEQSLRLEIEAWIETMSAFLTPREQSDRVHALLAEAAKFLSEVPCGQVFDDNLRASLREHLTGVLASLGELAKSVYLAFSIIYAKRQLEVAVDEAAILAREPMGSAEKEEMRASLLKCVEGFGDTLAALGRKLNANDATGGDPPVAPNDNAPK